MSKYRKFGRHADIIESVDFPSQENSTNSAACLSFQLLIRIRRLLAAFVLAFVLTVSASADDIDCGKTSEQSASDEVSTSASAACGEISCGVTQAVITIMLSLL